MDSENDNDKVNMPAFLSPKPTLKMIMIYLNDLDFFKDFENEFLAIVCNDALTSKSNFLTESTINIQHIDEFNLKDETSLYECDEEEQNVLYFNDVFLFNIIYPDDSKSDADNDNDKINSDQSSWNLSVKPLPDVINTDVGAYAQGSNKLLETIDTAYLLNEYSVFDTSINTAYPGEPSERKDLVDCIFSGILCVLFVLGFRPAFAPTFFLINATWRIYREIYQGSFLF
ncbi:hypothetical protein Tco_0551800 [Tanacetum coccineum]